MTTERPLDHSCLACQVRTGTICAPLTDSQLAEVEAIRLHDRIVPRGAHLFHTGEVCPNFYTVKSGWVMLYGLLVDGRRQIHGFGLPGAFLGHHPEDTTPVQYAAEALTDVTVCVLPREQTADLFRRMPDLAVSFACVAWHARDDAVRRLTSIARRSARERIADFLLDLHRRSHQPSSELPLTQEHIADALGLTSVHVSRTLKSLREEGIVSTQGHVLQVLDTVRLAEAALSESANA